MLGLDLAQLFLGAQVDRAQPFAIAAQLFQTFFNLGKRRQFAGGLDCPHAVGESGVVRRNVEAHRRAGMIVRVINRGAQAADATVACRRHDVCERIGRRAVKKRRCRAVAYARGQIADTIIILRDVSGLGNNDIHV